MIWYKQESPYIAGLVYINPLIIFCIMEKQKSTFLRNATAWLTAAAFSCLAFAPAQAQRESKTINDSWKFLKGECETAAQPHFDDSAWTRVHLPHTWNTDAYTHKDYYRGTGWYRRPLTLPRHWQGKQIFLRLDAASKAATVYIDGREVGEHAGGYTAATFDITSFCTFGTPHILAIRVNNARQDIPPISGDFTFFGGIYRDVWLTAVSAQHFSLTNHGSDGIFISTPQVSAEQGTLLIRGEIKNDAPAKASLELEHTVYHPDGSVALTKKQHVKLGGGELYTFRTETPAIPSPKLWTPETPHLYQVESVLRDKKTRNVLDCSRHYTAFRWFSFDGSRGFSLNGKPYKLRGICRHQDQKPVGVALTDEMHRRDVKLMKEMGANFIRISHYPQDDALLEQCDKLGLLAWEEIPVIDIVPDTPGYAETCERNLREMIRQHYNHPSIIAWGYMNEILLVTQRRYKKAEELSPVLERTLALTRRLEKVLKEEDTTRVSTIAFHGNNIYNETGLGEITDIVGWNLYQGWYGGSLTGFERFLEEQHRKYPTHPMIVSEYGAGSDKRVHSLHPKAFDFSSEYQQKYLEHYLPVLEETPYLCGGTLWNFIDFSSALRDEATPRINNKGLVYADRTPKDVYYYYKAAWRKDIPVLHIASRDWSRRAGVQHGSQPVLLPVKVYTNLPEVELFIDGQSLGRRKAENYTVCFDVPFSRKEHFVSVKARCGRAMKAQENGTPGVPAVGADHTLEDGLRLLFTPTPAKLSEENLKGLELAVNVGSDSFFTSDESRLTWVPDRPYEPGGWGYIGGTEQNSRTQVMNTPDVPLFQNVRSGIEAYRFDVPPGVYEVELLFTDIFGQHATTAYQLGQGSGAENIENSFDIVINGKAVEENFSPCRETGYFQALRKRYPVINQEEKIEIHFAARNGKSFLNGIKLRKLY